MSIKYKFLPSMLFIVITAAIVLGVCYFSFRGYVEETFAGNLDSASAMMNNYVADHTAIARQAVEAMSYHPELVAAMEAAIESRDPAPLVRVAQSLQQRSGVEFVTITDAEGIVLARSHEPDKYGDSVLSQLNVRQALGGQQYTDVEPGTQVKLSVRSGAPVFDANGTLIGAVSAGFRMDNPTLVDAIKKMTGSEVTIFLGDTRVATTILNSAGERAVGTAADPEVSRQVLGGLTYEGVITILGQEAMTKYTPLRNSAGEIVGMLFVGQYTTVEEQIIGRFLLVGALCALVMVLLAVGNNYIIAGRVTRSIQDAVSAANTLAEGDLDVSLDMAAFNSTLRKDETFELATALHRIVAATRQQADIIDTIASGDYSMAVTLRGDRDVMGQSLQKLLELMNSAFGEIVSASAQVTGGTAQMAMGVQALAAGATEQAAAIEELSSSVVDILHQSEENTRQAAAALDANRQSEVYMNKAMDSMARMTESMDEINNASKAISQVISVIDNIAFQTNILSLNASVEAARAGQQGKGFAVVAEEVRNLAAKSAKAAKETADLIQNSIQRVQAGTAIAQETSQNLSRVAELAEKNIAAVNFISEASASQSSAIAEVNRGIEQISSVVQQNSATAQEGAAASHEMSAQAQMLTQIVGRFRLSGAQIASRTQPPAMGLTPVSAPGIAPALPPAQGPYSYTPPANKYF